MDDQANTTMGNGIEGPGQPIVGGVQLPTEIQTMTTQTMAMPQVAPVQVNTTFSNASNTVAEPQLTGVDQAVADAMKIISRTQNNPVQQANELSQLKGRFLSAKYGIDVTRT